MNKEELRLGNYYIGYDNQYHQVDLYFFAQLYDGIEIDELIKNFVPLNEEWLLMFGFTKWAWCDDCAFIPLFFGEVMYCRFYNDEWHIKRMKVGKDSKGYFGETEGKYILPKGNIKHVHQLQNLYFALTNKELTIQ